MRYFLFIVLIVATFSSTAEEITSPVGNNFSEVQKKAVDAARGFSGSLYAPNSPEYSAAVRQNLNRSYPLALSRSTGAMEELKKYTDLQRLTEDQHIRAIVGGAPVNPDAPSLQQLSISKLDRDERYRSNLESLTSSSNRIWGGLPTKRYKNTVVITGGGGLCTGTVISKNAVLTAQHCHCGGANERVYVGDYYDDTQEGYKVIKSTPMKDCKSPPSLEADVALLVVNKEFDSDVIPAPLATSEMINSVSTARAVGFGRTEKGLVGQKMMVDIPVASTSCGGKVNTKDGPALDRDYYGCNEGFELVAGAPLLNKDTCNGDSGGPLFLVVGDQAYLMAATSRAVSTPGGRECGDGGIYVRVDGKIGKWLAGQGIKSAPTNLSLLAPGG